MKVLIGTVIIGLTCISYVPANNTKIRVDNLANATSILKKKFIKKLEKIQMKYSLPSLTAIVLDQDSTIVSAAVGKRAVDHKNKVTIKDKYHLGSNTKSMTAVLLAKLIERGEFQWADTIGDHFSHVKVHEKYKNVTLEQLLRHKGGTTSSLPASYPTLWREFFTLQQSGIVEKQRELLAHQVLTDEPKFQTGKNSNYSNAGISLVGRAIEKKFKESYETLLEKLVFSELGMDSCGFGTPKESVPYSHPRGHMVNAEKISSIQPGAMSDNPDAISPAGKVHCSITDWGKYIQEHLKGSLGSSEYLSRKSFAKLHTPLKNEQFALGWLSVKAGSNKALFHNGSNTMNYAEMYVLPYDNLAIGIVTNIGNQKAKVAVQKLGQWIIKEFKK